MKFEPVLARARAGEMRKRGLGTPSGKVPEFRLRELGKQKSAAAAGLEVGRVR